jgi:hypothetical protein
MKIADLPPLPGFAVLSMFLDQHGGKSDVAKGSLAPTIPFRNWKVGYVVVSNRAEGGEEWTIKNIASADGLLHREDCTVDITNKAGETRNLKGSTLQAGYAFVSTGDMPAPEPEARTDVKPFGVQPAHGGVREFYPRSNGEGTRIIMGDKTTYIVAESFMEVWQKFAAAGVVIAQSEHSTKKNGDVPMGVIADTNTLEGN